MNSHVYDHPGTMQDSRDYISDEEDEYVPLTMSSWGTQSVAKDGTTEINVSAAGWASLIDPNFKVKAGGLGSGGLHRKGANYKPVDEEFILNQRLKTKPILKKTAAKKGPSTPRTPATPKPPVLSSAPKPKKAAKAKATSASPAPVVRPSGKRPPPSSKDGLWGSSPLATTPFWESPESSQPATPSSAVPSGLRSRWGSAPAAAAPKVPATPTASGRSRWETEPLATNPPTVPSASTPRAVPNTPVTPATPATPATPFSASGERRSRWQTSSSTASEATSVSSHSRRSSVDVEPKRLVLNIELAPGITAQLEVHDTEDYMGLVNQFAERHHLSIAEESKHVFADRIRFLMENLRSQS